MVPGMRKCRITRHSGCFLFVNRGYDVRPQVGTPYWTAPEVIRNEVYNERADVCVAPPLSAVVAARPPQLHPLASLVLLARICTRT